MRSQIRATQRRDLRRRRRERVPAGGVITPPEEGRASVARMLTTRPTPCMSATCRQEVVAPAIRGRCVVRGLAGVGVSAS